MTHDPTIPRHSNRPPGTTTVWGPTWGRLVDYGDSLALVDMRTGWAVPCDLSNVQILTGSWGNTVEGVQVGPRPWKFEAGRAVVEGDNFLIVFLGNDHRHPVLIPGVRPPNPDDPGFFAARPIGEDPNPVRLRKVARNAAGAVTGTLEVTALDGGNGFEIVVGGGAFGTGTRIELDHDAGTVKIGQGSETHQVAFGEAIVQAIKTLAEGLLQLDTVVAAKLISSAPILTATVTPVITDCATSLSAGAPMLSNIVKVE